jgi:hypothetical protein
VNLTKKGVNLKFSLNFNKCNAGVVPISKFSIFSLNLEPEVQRYTCVFGQVYWFSYLHSQPSKGFFILFFHLKKKS